MSGLAKNSSVQDRPPLFGSAGRPAVVALFAQRLIVNTAARMVFTFLPAISRGSGLSVETLGQAFSARDATGLLGPWLGKWVGRFGAWRTVGYAGLVAAGSMVLIILGTIPLFIGFIAWGVCRSVYIIGINTWLSSVVRYEHRGRASGIMELTWAASAFLGLPLMGLLIQYVGWWAAPAVLAALGGPVALWMLKHSEHDIADPDTIGADVPAPALHANAVFGVTSFALLTAGSQFLWFSHGLWLEDTYGFDAAAIGFAIVLVGLAEAIASYGTSVITDQMGKVPATALGGTVLCIGLLALAFVPEPPLVIGLGLLAISFLGFEFAIVSSIPLMTELQPAARSRVLGVSVGLSTCGRAVVSLIAGWLYVRHGFTATAVSGAALVSLAVVLLVAVVREPVHS